MLNINPEGTQEDPSRAIDARATILESPRDDTARQSGIFAVTPTADAISSTSTTHKPPIKAVTSWPPYPHNVLHGRLAKGLVKGGSLLALAGMASITNGGAGLLVVGVLLMIPFLLGRLEQSSTHHRDLADASELRASFAEGELPGPVGPLKLYEDGGHLDPGEECLIDGARVEALVFYGDPIVLRRGFFVAWGSPLAWLASIIGFVLMRDMNRKAAKKAAPQWRDPVAAHLWVTDKRLIVHGRDDPRSSTELPFEELDQMRLDGDGIVLRLRSAPDKPLKLRLAHPAWYHALIQRIMSLAGVGGRAQ